MVIAFVSNHGRYDMILIPDSGPRNSLLWHSQRKLLSWKENMDSTHLGIYKFYLHSTRTGHQEKIDEKYTNPKIWV